MAFVRGLSESAQHSVQSTGTAGTQSSRLSMGRPTGFTQGKKKRDRRALLAARRGEHDEAAYGSDDEYLAPPARHEDRPGSSHRPAPPPRGPPAANPTRVPAAELSPDSLEARRAKRRAYEKDHYRKQKAAAAATVELPSEPYTMTKTGKERKGGKHAKHAKEAAKYRAISKLSNVLDSFGDESQQAQALKDLCESRTQQARRGEGGWLPPR